jgi:hypothetical protein
MDSSSSNYASCGKMYITFDVHILYMLYRGQPHSCATWCALSLNQDIDSAIISHKTHCSFNSLQEGSTERLFEQPVMKKSRWDVPGEERSGLRTFHSKAHKRRCLEAEALDSGPSLPVSSISSIVPIYFVSRLTSLQFTIFCFLLQHTQHLHHLAQQTRRPTQALAPALALVHSPAMHSAHLNLAVW